MKLQLGILACLLAGCVAQPTDVTSLATPSVAALPDDGSVLRIGLEFLPPDERFPVTQTVRVEPPLSSASDLPDFATTTSLLRREEEASRTAQLSSIELDKIDDPIARETLQFVTDLVAADRLRVRREVGIPFFDFQPVEEVRSPLLVGEQRLLEEQQQWSQEHGTRLLKRPLRLLARRLPIVREFEIALQDFRKDHVPLTEPYRQQHGDRRKLGRMSMRVHTRDLQDPVEIVYIHSGVRIGTSQTRGKLSVDFDINDSWNLSFRARTDYETGDSNLRTDLIYRPTTHTSVHLAAGDDMDFLSTSSSYSLFESPMDGSPGLVLYAIHTF